MLVEPQLELEQRLQEPPLAEERLLNPEEVQTVEEVDWDS
jgi:hypothetical protein